MSFYSLFIAMMLNWRPMCVIECIYKIISKGFRASRCGVGIGVAVDCDLVVDDGIDCGAVVLVLVAGVMLGVGIGCRRTLECPSSLFAADFMALNKKNASTNRAE